MTKEQQPGVANVKDFLPGKGEVAAVFALAGAALTGVVQYGLPPQETPSEATSPATSSEASVAVPYACEAGDGTVTPYEVEEMSDAAVMLSGTDKDFVTLTCADGSTLNTNTVEVHTMPADEATMIPQSTEVLLGNVPPDQDPVLKVSVDPGANTVTVTTDPATSIRDVKN